MTVDQMRAKISNVYDSFRWRDRVAKMPNNQVMAIYYNMLKHGRFDKQKKSKDQTQYRQMTIFDYI